MTAVDEKHHEKVRNVLLYFLSEKGRKIHRIRQKPNHEDLVYERYNFSTIIDFNSNF